MTWQRIALVALVQTIILVGMVAMRSAPYVSGTEVLLRTEPVDPRDLMRGYYVQLGYDISRLDVPADVAEYAFPGTTVFVVLSEGDDGYWQAGSVYLDREDAPQGTLTIRGKVRSVSRDWGPTPDEVTEPAEPRPMAEDQGTGGTLFVAYGIERYYADRDLAQELEGMQREQRISVAVGIAPSGAAGIRALLIDGERIAEEGLF